MNPSFIILGAIAAGGLCYVLTAAFVTVVRTIDDAISGLEVDDDE